MSLLMYGFTAIFICFCDWTVLCAECEDLPMNICLKGIYQHC